MTKNTASDHFPGWLHWPGGLNKNPTVWLDGVIPPLNEPNEGKSAASVCCQVAAWFVARCVLKLLFSETSQIAQNSATTEARKK